MSCHMPEKIDYTSSQVLMLIQLPVMVGIIRGLLKSPTSIQSLLNDDTHGRAMRLFNLFPMPFTLR
jgi:hypothetical protein